MSSMQHGAKQARWHHTFAAAAVLLACGCGDALVLYVDGGGPKRYEVASSVDDGAVRVVRSLLPGETTGYVFGDSPELVVGNLPDGTHVMASRALLRFNISGWTTGTLELWVRCTMRNGSPAAVGIYAVNDFGPLPEAGADAGDVSAFWNLPDSGLLVGTHIPYSGTWMTVRVPEQIIQARKSADGQLAFAIVYDTKDLPGNYYQFASFDQAASQGHTPRLQSPTYMAE
jgi:hypothetical protein